jgi:chloramphenicol-sensitive protein RarD
VDNHRTGLAAGVSAYLLWGLFPLYWPLLEPAAPVEILAHRIAWSLVFVCGLLALTAGFGWVRTLGRRRAGLLALAATLVTINWGTYIYGVNSEHVVETSLGYFINPLVTVLMGVLILGEHLRRLQWIAMGIAFVAVVVLTIDYGRPPWVALVLAFSFGTYGLLKKQAGVGAVESITLETLVIAPFAAAYIAWLVGTGESTFGSQGAGHAVLFTTTGIITAVPLMLFGAAAIRVSMVSLGLLQYLAPTIQFALGILVFDEAMPASRWIGFGLVWVALAIFTVEAVNHRRRQLRLVAHASAV